MSIAGGWRGHACDAAVYNLSGCRLVPWPSPGFVLKHRQISLRQIWNQTGNFLGNFSLLKLMFGDTQMSALADMVQSALMLRYNKRKVG